LPCLATPILSLALPFRGNFREIFPFLSYPLQALALPQNLAIPNQSLALPLASVRKGLP